MSCTANYVANVAQRLQYTHHVAHHVSCAHLGLATAVNTSHPSQRHSSDTCVSRKLRILCQLLIETCTVSAAATCCNVTCIQLKVVTVTVPAPRTHACVVGVCNGNSCCIRAQQCCSDSISAMAYHSTLHVAVTHPGLRSRCHHTRSSQSAAWGPAGPGRRRRSPAKLAHTADRLSIRWCQGAKGRLIGTWPRRMQPCMAKSAHSHTHDQVL